MKRSFSFLGLLARRGAYAARATAAGVDAQFAIFSQHNSVPARIGTIDDDAFAHALAASWIAPDACGTRWRLTAAGASAARAAKSRRKLRQPDKVKPARRRPSPIVSPIVSSESPLAWLRRHRDRNGDPLISAAQFDAGERLRADLWYAQMTPRVTSDWSGAATSRGIRRSSPGAGMELSDTVVAARQRVHSALRAVGAEFAGLLIDVCGHLKGLEQLERNEGWPQRSAKFFLRHALTLLARHYGLIRDEDEEALIGRRLRHWAVPDYRPNLGAWKGKLGK